MLKTELEQVIEYYETEKANLEVLIEKCIPEWDYLLAHYHSLALQQVNGRLQVLYNLRDPDYEEKNHLESTKSFYERLFGDDGMKIRKEYLVEKINEINEQLSTLGQKNNPPTIDGQELDDVIFDLVEGRIKAFKFHLKKASNLYIDFRLNENHLMISLTPIQEITEEYLISEETLTSLDAIGFVLNTQTNTTEYRFELVQFRNSIFLKTLISRIVFEIFYYKQFDNPTSIEVRL